MSAPDINVPEDAEDAGHGPSHRRSGPLAAVGSAVREVVVVIVMALLLSFVVKTWLLQAFFIPSGSMEDTLLVGDRVVVSKLNPTPFAISRGDVVVFQDPGGWLDLPPPVERSGVSGAVHDALVFVGLLPAESEDHLIKRVIGLPGDRVTCCSDGGLLSVNGEPISEPAIGRPRGRAVEARKRGELLALATRDDLLVDTGAVILEGHIGKLLAIRRPGR